MVTTANNPHDPQHRESSTHPRQPDTLIRWRCPNCGQTHFTAPDDEPPDICAYCCDMTTWKRLNDSESDD
jgi:rubrerythrin